MEGRKKALGTFLGVYVLRFEKRKITQTLTVTLSNYKFLALSFHQQETSKKRTESWKNARQLS